MKVIKKILNGLLYFLFIPMIYLIISLILTAIPVDRTIKDQVSEKSIYLSTNGVHLDIIIPEEHITPNLRSGLKYSKNDVFLAFGWGDENFYINTPTWGDVTFSNAFRALFLASRSSMHITRYKSKHPDWVEVEINETELGKLNKYLQDSFQTDKNGRKIKLQNEGYSTMDDFYRARGSYTFYRTCNSWVNAGLKESGLKACLWTPFDFGLMNKYK